MRAVFISSPRRSLELPCRFGGFTFIKRLVDQDFAIPKWSAWAIFVVDVMRMDIANRINDRPLGPLRAETHPTVAHLSLSFVVRTPGGAGGQWVVGPSVFGFTPSLS
jgi:hypothetical protein